MRVEDWKRVKEIFAAASELPAQDRAGFLNRECTGDDELRAEVESLLCNAMTAAGQLSAGFHPMATIPLVSGESAGMQIGLYKLIRELGEGGFGSVWLAEQKQPVLRQVALKIIKLGMDTKQVIARFEAERQALAIMDHPNISRVIDGGSTDTGRPYFVMELVKGIPITDYCDQHRLTIRQRMELLVPVCEAVQHAHQKGIIHRDIKPSNVLITQQDGKPMPKVIDFGIAKAINQQLTEKIVFTREDQMIGTPAYMSPEQAGASTLNVDTRSDVYSLGVLMYELLVGDTPFSDGALRSATHDEIARLIREVEPTKPSSKLSTVQELPGIATRRKTDPSTLTQTIRGELDWIAMKCLEKDPSRRYQSANGLAADLERFLTGDVVFAAPPSRIYRTTKFLHRHRLPVAGTAAAIFLLVAGVTLYIRDINLERHRTMDALRQAEAQSENAMRQASIAEAVSQFQLDMLANAAPDSIVGDKVTVLEAMKAAIAELADGKLRDQPITEAAIRWEIGKTLMSLGSYPEARANYDRAISLLTGTDPTSQRLLGRVLSSLGLLVKVQEDPPGAEAIYRKALMIQKVLLPPEHPDIAVTIGNLASALQDQNRLDESEQLYREALRIRQLESPADKNEIAKLMNNLGSLFLSKGNLSEGTGLLREAMTLRRAILRPDHPLIVQSTANLAMALQAQGQLSEAETMLRESLAARRRTLPPGHTDIASIAHNLGRVLVKEGKLADAEPLLREALDIRIKELGPTAVSTVRSASALADLLECTNRAQEATTIRTTYGTDHTTTAPKAAPHSDSP